MISFPKNQPDMRIKGKAKCVTIESNESTVYSENKELTYQQYLPAIDLLVDIKRKKKPHTYCIDYQEICKALRLNPNERKIKMDSLFKKCKAKFCKSLQETIFFLIGDRTKISKMPQRFVTNINIKYNQKYMNCTLEEIYRDLNVFSSLEYFKTLTSKNYLQISQLFKMTYAETYHSFLMSNLFTQQLKRLFSKKGLKITLLFYYTSHLFLDYIKTSKGTVVKENKKCDYLVNLVKKKALECSSLVPKDKKLFSVHI